MLLVIFWPPMATNPVISKSGIPGLAGELLNPGMPSAVPAPAKLSLVKKFTDEYRLL